MFLKISLFFFGLLFWLNSSGSEHFNSLTESISAGYPKERYVSGGFSTLFGAVSIIKAQDILRKNREKNEDVVAFGLIAVGSLRVVDGSYQLFSPSPVEVAIKEGQLQSSNELLNFSNQSFRRRMWRASAIAFTAVSYLYLYSQDNQEYDKDIWVGSILVGIAALKFFKNTPEEKVNEELNRDSISWNILPMKKGFELGVSYSY